MFAFEQKLSTEFVFFSTRAFLAMPSMWGVYMIYIYISQQMIFLYM